MPASRSLIVLLIGTVAFFALWLVALKPGGSGHNGSSQGLGQYQSAINKAHQAVATSNASNAASGNDGTSSSSSTASSSGSSTTSTHSSTPKSGAASQSTHPVTPGKHASSHSRAAIVHLSTVQHAMAAHKVVAMLFYNPLAADDQAVKQELAEVPAHKGHVVKLTIPLSEASNFTAVTQQVPVNVSPTLVLIAPGGQAREIVGFSDQLEIAQRVADALATK